jgi:protein-tyrosine phosphatase
MQDKEFEEFIKRATRAGLTPVIAHAERYPAVRECPDIVAEMRGWGAYIQVNCDPILGKSGKEEQEVVKYLIQNEMADLVSSDAHDMQRRSPRLNKCYGVLKKKFGKNTADKLLLDNAEVLIHGKQ